MNRRYSILKTILPGLVVIGISLKNRAPQDIRELERASMVVLEAIQKAPEMKGMAMEICVNAECLEIDRSGEVVPAPAVKPPMEIRPITTQSL